MRLARTLVFALLLLALSACIPNYNWQKTEQPQTMEIRPPRIYGEWWKQMRKCSQLRIPFNRLSDVHFYVVEGDYFYAFPYKEALAGMYDPLMNKVYLAQSEMFNRTTVAHEMLHALGVWGHPDEYFVKRCNVK